MDLMVDDVPLEKGYIEIMVDEQGRLGIMTCRPCEDRSRRPWTLRW